MQIYSIQTSQPSFGTTIKADLKVLSHYKDYGRYVFENLVKQLENNGRNDVFVLSATQGHDKINAFTYEIRPSKNGYGKHLESSIVNFESYSFDPKKCNEHKLNSAGTAPKRTNGHMQNLVEIYNKCYEDMMKDIPTKVNKLGDWIKYLI